MYRCEATSVAGFIQQLAVSYVSNGYWFYVTGEVPARKDPRMTDQKIIRAYDIDLSKWTRCRRKQSGFANVHYLRHARTFVIIVTRGRHRFFDLESGIRDVRRAPIQFRDYSIGCTQGSDGMWHASVRIAREQFTQLKTTFRERATHCSREELEFDFRHLRFEPYSPVRRQLFVLLRAVNRARRAAGLELVLESVVTARRQPVKPFG